MTAERVKQLLESQTYKYAYTMPWCPHWWSHRDNWQNDKDFVDVVLFIRANGKHEFFGKQPRIYYYCGDYKYWTMGNPVCYNDKSKTFILNRAKIKKDDHKNGSNDSTKQRSKPRALQTVRKSKN